MYHSACTHSLLCDFHFSLVSDGNCCCCNSGPRWRCDNYSSHCHLCIVEEVIKLYHWQYTNYHNHYRLSFSKTEKEQTLQLDKRWSFNDAVTVHVHVWIFVTFLQWGNRYERVLCLWASTFCTSLNLQHECLEITIKCTRAMKLNDYVWLSLSIML